MFWMFSVEPSKLEAKMHEPNETVTPKVLRLAGTSFNKEYFNGLVVIEGQIYGVSASSKPVLFVYPDRPPRITDSYTLAELAEVKFAIGGRTMVVKNGVSSITGGYPQNSRYSIIGVTDSGEFMLFFSDHRLKHIASALILLGVKNAMILAADPEGYLEVEGEVVCGQLPRVTIEADAYTAYPRPYIFLELAHGGRDTGVFSPCGTVQEKNLNLSHGLNINDYLSNFECTVFLSRYADVSSADEDNREVGATLEADLSMSIHSSIGEGGVDSFVPADAPLKVIEKQRKFGAILQRRLAGMSTMYKGEFRSLSLRTENCILLRLLSPLVKEDLAVLRNPASFISLSNAVAGSIVELLNLQQRGCKPPKEEVEQFIYKVYVGEYHHLDSALRRIRELRSSGFDAILTKEKAPE